MGWRQVVPVPVARPQLREKGAHGAIPQFLRCGGYSCVHCLLLLVHNNNRRVSVCCLVPTATQLARARYLYRVQRARAQEHTQRVSGAPAWVCARKENRALGGSVWWGHCTKVPPG